MKVYVVTVRRQISQWQDFSVEAETEDEAKAEALKEAESSTFTGDWDDCSVPADDHEVEEVRESKTSTRRP